MSAPVKFLAVAVAGWVTFRAAASALALPDGVALPQPAPAPAPAEVPPQSGEAPVTYAPLEGTAVAAAGPSPGGAPPSAYAPAAYPYPAPYGYAPPGYGPPSAPRPASIPVPIYYPVPIAAAATMPLPRQTPWTAAPNNGAEPSPLAADEAPVSRPEPLAVPDPGAGPGPAVTPLTLQGVPRLDRWSLTSWSLMRQETAANMSGALPTNPALATGGQLGGSQAGTRLTYRFTPRLAVSARLSGPVPTSRSSRSQGYSGEAALGVSWQPLAGLPLRVMAERRQRLGGLSNGMYGGRNAFALLAEGGIYGKALPLGFTLDGYGQTGVVSLRQRDWFVDGGLVATRPLFGRYSAGLGFWGGAQKGLNRFDVGPRLSAQLTRSIRANLDYRYQAFGNARPGSGFAVSVSSDF